MILSFYTEASATGPSAITSPEEWAHANDDSPFARLKLTQDGFIPVQIIYIDGIESWSAKTGPTQGEEPKQNIDGLSKRFFEETNQKQPKKTSEMSSVSFKEEPSITQLQANTLFNEVNDKFEELFGIENNPFKFKVVAYRKWEPSVATLKEEIPLDMFPTIFDDLVREGLVEPGKLPIFVVEKIQAPTIFKSNGDPLESEEEGV